MTVTHHPPLPYQIPDEYFLAAAVGALLLGVCCGGCIYRRWQLSLLLSKEDFDLDALEALRPPPSKPTEAELWNRPTLPPRNRNAGGATRTSRRKSKRKHEAGQQSEPPRSPHVHSPHHGHFVELPSPTVPLVPVTLSVEPTPSVAGPSERELKTMNLKQLRLLAQEVGVDEDSIETARDHDEPQSELIGLITAARRHPGGGGSGRSRPRVSAASLQVNAAPSVSPVSPVSMQGMSSAEKMAQARRTMQQHNMALGGFRPAMPTAAAASGGVRMPPARPARPAGRPRVAAANLRVKAAP